MAFICDDCVHYDCDEEDGSFYCTMDLDEDEMEIGRASCRERV